MIAFIKRVIDGLANIAKEAEELIEEEPTLLQGVPRSIQCDWYSCGAQSAYMILKYYDKARSIENTEQALGTTDEGTSPTQLRRLFQRRGLKPRRIGSATVVKLKAAIDDGCPVLVCLDENDGGHWGVVYGYARGAIYVADPSLKRAWRCRHTTAEFRRRWKGWAMAVKK